MPEVVLGLTYELLLSEGDERVERISAARRKELGESGTDDAFTSSLNRLLHPGAAELISASNERLTQQLMALRLLYGDDLQRMPT